MTPSVYHKVGTRIFGQLRMIVLQANLYAIESQANTLEAYWVDMGPIHGAHTSNNLSINLSYANVNKINFVFRHVKKNHSHWNKLFQAVEMRSVEVLAPIAYWILHVLNLIHWTNCKIFDSYHYYNYDYFYYSYFFCECVPVQFVISYIILNLIPAIITIS